MKRRKASVRLLAAIVDNIQSLWKHLDERTQERYLDLVDSVGMPAAPLPSQQKRWRRKVLGK